MYIPYHDPAHPPASPWLSKLISLWQSDVWKCTEKPILVGPHMRSLVVQSIDNIEHFCKLKTIIDSNRRTLLFTTDFSENFYLPLLVIKQ